VKITAVTTAVVNAQMRNWVVVKVSTDEGVVGWGEASLEVTLMAAIREAVGPEVDVMVDLHARTTPVMAIHYGVVLGPFRPFFLEEPCPPENVGGMAEVTRAPRHPHRHGRALGDPLGLPRAAGAAGLRGDPAGPVPLRRAVGGAQDCRDGRDLLRQRGAPPLTSVADSCYSVHDEEH